MTEGLLHVPTALRYETFPAPPVLADHVEHFWMVEAPAHPAPHREILIPNGRPTVLVCLAEPGRRVAIDGSSAASNVSSWSGLLTRPLVLEQDGVSCYVAAQLRPWGLRAFGLPPLVDSTRPLARWLGAEAASGLEAACAGHGFCADATLPLQALLSGRARSFPPDRLLLLRSALEAIEAERGLIGIDTLLDRLRIGYDALYRLFRGHVGVPVKRFISIVRFYHFTGELLRGGPGSLALLAGLQGYYDQAHASREFRRFTGISQTEFRRHLNGIARLMHRMT